MNGYIDPCQTISCEANFFVPKKYFDHCKTKKIAFSSLQDNIKN